MVRRKIPELTHLAADGSMRMVDVGAKDVTSREAIATAIVRMSPATARLLQRGALPKGDAIATAKVAGVLGAKQASSLIPLTHPLPIDYIDVEIDVRSAKGEVRVRATVRCSGKTGVEIEAMTACVITCLTIYDMCKSADKGISIERVRLEEKSGGKSGTWRRGARGARLEGGEIG